MKKKITNGAGSKHTAKYVLARPECNELIKTTLTGYWGCSLITTVEKSTIVNTLQFTCQYLRVKVDHIPQLPTARGNCSSIDENLYLFFVYLRILIIFVQNRQKTKQDRTVQYMTFLVYFHITSEFCSLIDDLPLENKLVVLIFCNGFYAVFLLELKFYLIFYVFSSYIL